MFIRPLYWYPDVYERNVRSTFIPSLYETPEWAQLSSANINNDDDDDNLGMNTVITFREYLGLFHLFSFFVW